MASLRTAVFRHVTRQSGPPLRLLQKRHAQVHDVRFVATHRNPNSVLEKYKEQLEKKAQAEGHENIDSLKEAYKDRIESLRKQAFAPDPLEPSAAPQKPSSSSLFPTPPPPPQPQQASSPSPSAARTASPGSPEAAGIKTLSSFLDLEKVSTLPANDISQLWRLRHASSPTSVCASIPATTYHRIASTARKHPQFILPIPREVLPEQLPEGSVEPGAQGPQTAAEIHFLQWAFPTPTTHTILFTSLAEFKARGEYATPHTTITHHLELAEDKGLVLLQGQVIENRGVTVQDAKWLLLCLQKFYLAAAPAAEGQDGQQIWKAEDEAGGKRRELLERFSRGDGGFKVEELLEEAEKIS